MARSRETKGLVAVTLLTIGVAVAQSPRSTIAPHKTLLRLRQGDQRPKAQTAETPSKANGNGRGGFSPRIVENVEKDVIGSRIVNPLPFLHVGQPFTETTVKSATRNSS